MARLQLEWVAPLLVSTAALAGPVEVYRTGPEFCPHDRAADAPPITDAQAIQRARALLPRDFCGPSAFVTGCDADSEWANGAWRVFVQQYRRSGERKDAGGLTHSYVILDRVGNCLANIPGTELGGRN